MAKKRKQIFLIFAWTVLATVILTIAGGIFLFFKTEKYINQNLSAIVTEKSGGLYNLNFNEIILDYKNRSISVTDVQLEINEQKSEEILKLNPEKIFYTFKSPEIRVEKIHLILFLKTKHFYCQRLVVEEPDLVVSGLNGIEKNSDQTFAKFFVEIRPLFKKQVKEVRIKEIDFKNANYRVFGAMGDSLQVSNANQISLIVKDFRTDSTAIFSENHFFSNSNILVQMNHFKYNLADSIHAIKIDTLEYSLNTSDIFAKGFELNHEINGEDKNLYSVQVPELYMKSKSITRFEINDSLKIQFLQFKKPKIAFFQKQNSSKISVEELSNFNLYNLIENQFQSLSIDTFELYNAQLKIFKQPDHKNFKQNFGNLNVSLRGFELDSSSSKNPAKLFHSNNMEMAVQNYQLKLEDNLHDFKADSMYFSTFSNSLGIKNIHIFPLENSDKKSRTEAKIECKWLGITNVNLSTLYHTRRLPTTKIEIIEPAVNIEYNTEIEKNEKQLQSGLLFDLVSAYLRGVYAEVVDVKTGKLSIKNIAGELETGYFETDFNFNLAGFSLDSTSIKQTDKFFYATNFDIAFSNYQMKLVDNLHKINVDKIAVKSFDRKVEIENLNLKPVIEEVNDSVMLEFNRSELYNISVPIITLWGIDLRRAFFFNRLNVSTFQISNPSIYFEYFGAVREKRDTKEFDEFYQLLFNYIKDFNIKKINIPNGNFNWVNHTKSGKTTSFDNAFSATLENFKLNDTELNKKRLLFSDHFDLSVKDQIFQLSDSVHILRAGEINLSTKNASISITNGLLYPLITTPKFTQLSTTFQVSIPQLHIRNFDFAKAFYSRELQLGSIDLNQARFQIYTKPQQLKTLDFNKYKFPFPSFIQSLHLAQFRINKGEIITYETDGLKTTAKSNFMVDLVMPDVTVKNNANNQGTIKSSNLLVQLHNFNAPLQNSHTLKINEIIFNRNKKNLFIETLKIDPIKIDNVQNYFRVAAPSIKFNEFDFNKAINNNDIIFNSIEISNPQIEIEINDSVQGDKFETAKNLDLYPFIEPFVNSVEVKKLQLLSSELKFNWFEKQIIDKKINLIFNDILIAKNQSPENLLNSREFEISVTDLRKISKNKLYEFSADSLIYNSRKHQILLSNIQVNPLLPREEFPRINGFQTDVLQSEIGFIEIANVNENALMKQNILEAGTLKIGPSKTQIYRNKRYSFNHQQRPPWPQKLLVEIKQDFTFDSLQILPALIVYTELTESSDIPAKLEFKNLEVSAGKISNIKSELKKQAVLNVHAEAEMFRSNRLKANFTFNLLSPRFEHDVKGSLGKMPLTQINAILEKSAPVKIESGDLQRFDFSFSIDNKQAIGELYFAYDNFEISLLEFNNNKTKKAKWASFWANKLVLNSKNPKGDELLPVKISYERDPERSILNYWWKAILTGSKETIGIPSTQTEKSP